MFDDDFAPKTGKTALFNLEPLSVDELTARIAHLKSEIARVEAEIARKKAYADAASSFFKK